jgi:hypothetical protein
MLSLHTALAVTNQNCGGRNTGAGYLDLRGGLLPNSAADSLTKLPVFLSRRASICTNQNHHLIKLNYYCDPSLRSSCSVIGWASCDRDHCGHFEPFA